MVPGQLGFSFFQGRRDTVIPWQNIRKIGEDVVLVDVDIGGIQLSHGVSFPC